MTRRILLGALLLAAACKTADKAPPPADTPDTAATPIAVDSTLPNLRAAPTTGVRSTAIMEASYKPDTSLYKIVYTLDKKPRLNDSVRVYLQRDTTGGNVGRTNGVWRFAQKDSANLKIDKVFGKVASYRGCVFVRNGTQLSLTNCKTWQTNIPAKPDTIIPKPDTVTIDSSLAVRSILIRPEVAKVAAVVPGVPVADSNRVQFCAAARLNNDSIVMAEPSRSVPGCDSWYKNMPGFSLSFTGHISEDSIRVHVDGGNDLLKEVDLIGRVRGFYFIVRPRIQGAYYKDGEWWLITPQPLPRVS